MEFSAHQMPADVFDDLKAEPFLWTGACGSLLRAARMVWRHANAECMTPGRGHYDVMDQALMLVAMACEVALKGLALARDPSIAGSDPGVLPKALRDHDLWTLATMAKYAPADEDQELALKVGHYFIALNGRYPTGTAAKNTPAASARSNRLFEVYDAIVLACVAATSMVKFGNADASKAHLEGFKRGLAF